MEEMEGSRRTEENRDQNVQIKKKTETRNGCVGKGKGDRDGPGVRLEESVSTIHC